MKDTKDEIRMNSASGYLRGATSYIFVCCMNLFVIQPSMEVVGFVSSVKCAILFKLMVLAVHYFILSITNASYLMNKDCFLQKFLKRSKRCT